MDLPERRVLDQTYISEIVGQPVKTFSVSEGSKKGDNVIGKMLALTVETDAEEDTEKGETLHIVIKSLVPLTGELKPEVIGSSQFFNELKVFPTEVAFYNEVRPLLQQSTGYLNNIPKFYSAKLDDLNDYIALEDLRPKGYKMGDKWKGLSLAEVKMILRYAAALHAHSYAVIAQNGSKIKELQSSILGSHIWGRHVFDLDQSILFNVLIEKMVEVMHEIGEVETAAKMKRFVKLGHGIVMDLFRKTGESSKYFRVTLHGDLWTNNALFKYSNNGDVEDVAFIDYQQSRFGNVYEDLEYFFFTSTTAEFRKNHLRSCLKHYHEEFAQVLQRLDTALPTGFTDEELIATFYENLEYGFCYNLIAIPFQLVEQGPPMDEAGAPPEDKPPSALAMALLMAQVMKEGAKRSPIALQRLKEMANEMIKLNILH